MTDSLISGLKAAGEPTRFRVLCLLRENELTVTEITQILGQSQPRVSRHLKLLTDAGLIERRAEGAWAFYRLASSEGAKETNGVKKLARMVVDLAPEEDAIRLRDLERLEAVKKSRSEIADAYFRENAKSWDTIRKLHIPEAQVEETFLDCISSLGPLGMAIDLGTGTGRILEVLSDHIEHGLGIDSSPEMLAIARSTLEKSGITNCEVRQADVYALSLEEQSADLITIHQVLHFLPDPEKVVVEATRLLKPGGHMLVIDFAPHEIEFLRTEHAHRRLGFATPEVEAWCKEAGLAIAEERHLPPSDKETREQLTVSVWLLKRVR